MEGIIEYIIALVAKHPMGVFALGVLGSFVVIASLVVAMTPIKSDDAWVKNKVLDNKYLGPLWKALEKFSLIKKS